MRSINLFISLNLNFRGIQSEELIKETSSKTLVSRKQESTYSGLNQGCSLLFQLLYGLEDVDVTFDFALFLKISQCYENTRPSDTRAEIRNRERFDTYTKGERQYSVAYPE